MYAIRTFHRLADGAETPVGEVAWLPRASKLVTNARARAELAGAPAANMVRVTVGDRIIYEWPTPRPVPTI
jgi:hypothetical protein